MNYIYIEYELQMDNMNYSWIEYELHLYRIWTTAG